jgi:hypothetical protein
MSVVFLEAIFKAAGRGKNVKLIARRTFAGFARPCG